MLKKNRYSAKKNEWRNIKANTNFVRDDVNPEAVKNKEARAEETIICYLLKRPQECRGRWKSWLRPRYS